MKNVVFNSFLFLIMLPILFSQINFEKEYKKLHLVSSDSLKGFDEVYFKNLALKEGFTGKELYAYLLRNSRNFINQKYSVPKNTGISIQNLKLSSPFQTMGPPCNNENFELGNGSGWTLNNESWTTGPCSSNAFATGASEFWVLATPIADPNFPGGIPASPLGGNFVAKLNDVNPTGGSTMIRQTFPVTVNSALFRFAWAACFDGSGHGCCNNPFLKIRVLDCSNNVLACPQISIVASGPSCSSGMPGFSTNSNGYSYKNWTQQAIDLTPYVGSCVTIEVFVGDCTGGAHHGYAYFDAECSPMYVSVNNVQYPLTTNTVFACGVTSATIAAPPGLGPYNWNGPPGSGITNLNQQQFTTSTPGTYTLTVNPTGGCGPITRTLNVQFMPVPNAGFTTTNNCQNFTITNTGSGPPAVQSYSFLGTSPPANFTTTSASNNVSFGAAGQYTILQTVSNGSCSSAFSLIVNAPQPINVGFNANNVCFPMAVNFTNTSSSFPGTTYFWDFDNNGTWDSNTQNPSFNYPAPGQYTVKLKVTNTSGCKDSINQVVQVYPNVTAGFTSTNICNSFTFNNTGSAAPAIQSYTFLGAGGPPSFTTTNANTSMTITPGTYTLLQTVGNGSCSANHSLQIIVPAPVTASFDVQNVCQNSSLSFTNYSNPIAGVSFQWDFDNNGTWDSNITSPNPLLAPGNYTVKLKITASTGCTDSIYKPVSVWGRAVPDFTANPVCFGTIMNFTNTTSTSVNMNTGSISTYQWFMGDGNQYNTANVSHLYTTPTNSVNNTTYTVKLVVSTQNACTDSISKNVTVYSNPTPQFIADSVCLGNLTTLQDLSNGNGNPLFQFQWDFDNDLIADVTNNSLSTQHQFTMAGNNPVNYTVITNTGINGLTCKSSTTQNVWVHPSPVGSMTHTDLCVYAQPIPFDASGSSVAFGSLTFDWYFGDGNQLPNGGATPSHSYSSPGTYTAFVIVTSDYGCTVQVSQPVNVWDTPKGYFTYTKHCQGKPTLLSAYTTSNSAQVSQYQWDLDNNSSNIELNAQNGIYTFSNPGLQPVNLYLTSINGCTNLITGSVYVNYNPKANFFAPKRSGCTDLCIPINDSSLTFDGASITQWIWDYGNGMTLNSSTSVSNTICYQNSSNTTNQFYYIKLTVKTDSGCVDSVLKRNYITVYPKPHADFTWRGEDGDLLSPYIQFENQSVGHFYSHWYFNDGINNFIDSVNQHPKHYYDTDVPREYQVWLAVRNYYGCKDTVSKTVKIEPIFIIYFPNTFTPNGDNVNDYFYGKGVGIKEYKMWIFDRWGEQLYYTNDINAGWDGRKRGYDEILKSDVYVWKAEVQDFRGKWHSYNGHVTLLK